MVSEAERTDELERQVRFLRDELRKLRARQFMIQPQRTDTTAPDGLINVYRSGATLVHQVFDKDAGAWRSVTLS